MKFRVLFGAAVAAGLLASVVPASAITLTGEATSATIKDEFAVTVAETGGTNPAILSLGPIPAEFTASISVVNSSSAGFTADQKYTNNSGVDRVLNFSTINRADEFSGADLRLSTDNGATFTSLGLGDGSFVVSAGTDFVIRAFATDVLNTAQFDYSISAVPLPAAAWLLLTALGGLGGYGFVSRRQAAA